MRYILLLFILGFTGRAALSQVIDHSSTFMGKSDHYLRFHYDNDFFTKSDEYYTQGITLEWANPAFKKNPLNKVLLRSRNSSYKYGLAIVDFGYTPTSIDSNVILYGDRPFAGNLALSSFVSSRDSVHERLITSIITIGLIGQGAGGKEMQETIHRWLDNPQPYGWQYQIRNDLLLTYQVNYEQKLAGWSNNFLLNAAGEVKLGTHTNKLKAGINFMAGSFNDPYRSTGTRKKISCYLYGQVQPGLAVYDASLQGGLFNKSSPYTIPAADIERFTVQADYGIVLIINKLYLQYCQSILTREFSTGHYHRWGGFRVGIDL